MNSLKSFVKNIAEKVSLRWKVETVFFLAIVICYVKNQIKAFQI